MQREEPATPSFDDGFEVSRLVIRYALTGLVTLMLVSVVTAFVSRRIGTQEAIEDARRVASITATAAVEPVLQDSILQLDADAIVAVDDAVRFQVIERVPSLLRVKLWSRDGTPHVWKVDPGDSTVRPVPVRTGGFLDDRVRIVAGLRAGDRVVTAGAKLLAEGQKIRLVEAAP